MDALRIYCGRQQQMAEGGLRFGLKDYLRNADEPLVKKMRTCGTRTHLGHGVVTIEAIESIHQFTEGMRERFYE